jgi:HK97 gp10 family phage protein
MKLQVRTLGMSELKRNLRGIADRGVEILEPGLSAAAEVVRDEMERQAPVGNSDNLPEGFRPGYLKRSILVQKIQTKELYDAAPTFHVGPNRDAFYGYFLEFGTKFIPRGKYAFAVRAFDYSESKAIEAVAAAVKSGLEKVS